MLCKYIDDSRTGTKKDNRDEIRLLIERSICPDDLASMTLVKSHKISNFFHLTYLQHYHLIWRIILYTHPNHRTDAPDGKEKESFFLFFFFLSTRTILSRSSRNAPVTFLFLTVRQ